MSDNLLLKYRIKHTLHGSRYILDCIVDDLVKSDIYALTVCCSLGNRIRSDVKANDDCIWCWCKDNIWLVDRTNAAMDDLDHNLLIWKLDKTLLNSFNWTLYICLYDDIKLLHVAWLNLWEQIIKWHLCLCILDELILLLWNICVRECLCLLLWIACHKCLSCWRHTVESKYLYRCRRLSLLYSAALVINHGSYLTIAASTCDWISDMECSFLYKHCGNRTTAFIKLCFNYETSCVSIRISLELEHLCCEKNHLKEIVDTLLSMCRYRTEYCASAPILRDKLILWELLLNLVDIGTWLIYLVDCNDNLNTCCLCMVYCLNSLRHYTIICSNNKDCDISRVCTTHTHCCKCLMSRCIKECDVLAIDWYNRCTNVLCDTTCLTVCNTCLSDGIKQWCLTMIYVTHYADYRWTRNHLALILFILLEKLCNHIDLLLFLTYEIEL